MAKARKLTGPLTVLAVRADSAKGQLQEQGVSDRVPCYIIAELDETKTAVAKFQAYWTRVLAGKNVEVDATCGAEIVEPFLKSGEGIMARVEAMAAHAKDSTVIDNPEKEKKEKQEKKDKTK